MNKFAEYRNIIVDLIKLSLPIFAGNISHILIGITDTAIAGRYSTLALGAISVASAIIMTVTVGAIGLILSVSPVIANYRGQRVPTKKYFKTTLLFAIVVSVPFFIITEIIIKNIGIFGLNPELIQPMKQYMEICAWSIFPVAIFVSLKEFLQAYEKVMIANITMLIMVVINFILNLVLTFGFDFHIFKIPALGLLGLSYATLLSKILSAVFILIYCIPLFKTTFEKGKKYIKELFKVGLPISASIFFEFLGFNLTAVLIGKFSAVYAGVHNIILCIANFTFMIVLSVSNAASIKVGFYNGKKDKQSIIKYSVANIFITLCVCFVTFNILFFFSDKIISIFTTDAEVIKLSKNLLKFAMAFLFFDGIQGACVGILKGLKDTKIIMYTMLFVYLIIALPIGCYLAFKRGIVLEGFWLGLALALFSASIITGSRVVYKIKKLSD